MKSLSAIAWSSVLIPIFMVAGCAHVPVQETAQYADAFRDVSAVTRDVIDDYSAALDAVEVQDAASETNMPAYPLQFDPNAARAAEAVPPARAGFENALRAMEEYNASLLDLANGGSDAKIAARATAISNYLDALGAMPAGLPIADIAQQLLTMLSRAKSAKEFEVTIEQGKPLIEQLLHHFADSTADFYRVRVGLVGAAITEIEFKQETVLSAIDDLSGEYAPPIAGTELALRRAQLESEVALLRAEIAPSHAGKPLPVGSAPYDAEAQARIEEHAGVLRGLCAERQRLVESLAAYHAQLGEYVRVLDETSAYFDVLVRKTEPRDVAVRAHAVSSRAGELRTEMRSARSAQAIPNTHTQ